LERNPKARFRSIPVVTPRPPGFRYVIIGNSAAGRAAARAISALDPDGKLTVISEEPVPLYYRPVLPDFIGGLDRESFFAMGAATYEDEGLEILLGERATKLDIEAKQVLCESGRRVPYDALLLATGSSPVQIPWPGSDAEGIAYFRSFTDAERIVGLMSGAKKAVVVGGGLLGLEFVRAFLAAGLKVSLLVRENRVGFPALDEQGGPLIQQALLDLGVELCLEEEVASFEVVGGKVCGVNTSRGRRLDCDLVGVAVGVRPRAELAAEAGIAIDRGILVDRRMETSAPDIYAAGDVAQAWDRLWGQQRINTSWRNATEQGEWAGIAMAGGAGEYPGAVAANYQLAAGVPFCALGISTPPDNADFEVEAQVDPHRRSYRKIVKWGGDVVGAVLIADLSEAGDLEQKLRAVQSVPVPTANPMAAPPATPTPGAPQPESTGETKSEPHVPEPREERKSAMKKMTEQFLKEAFAGESQAHMKYLNFAQKAAEEGKENVARLFRAASYAEQVHASRHLAVMGGVGGTAENLAAAAGGEGFEIEEMYPAYIAVAIDQDEPEAQESFNHALQTEKVHRDLYERAKKAVDAGGDAAIDVLWVCDFCGYTMEGDPPDKCPLCGNPKKSFVKF
jgi:NADPH-dependent 2,4-dienoyl-CoA reductase/sulfur reductase-like enzyme/rubrerythrin